MTAAGPPKIHLGAGLSAALGFRVQGGEKPYPPKIHLGAGPPAAAAGTPSSAGAAGPPPAAPCPCPAGSLCALWGPCQCQCRLWLPALQASLPLVVRPQRTGLVGGAGQQLPPGTADWYEQPGLGRLVCSRHWQVCRQQRQPCPLSTAHGALQAGAADCWVQGGRAVPHRACGSAGHRHCLPDADTVPGLAEQCTNSRVTPSWQMHCTCCSSASSSSPDTKDSLAAWLLLAFLRRCSSLACKLLHTSGHWQLSLIRQAAGGRARE